MLLISYLRIYGIYLISRNIKLVLFERSEPFRGMIEKLIYTINIMEITKPKNEVSQKLDLKGDETLFNIPKDTLITLPYSTFIDILNRSEEAEPGILDRIGRSDLRLSVRQEKNNYIGETRLLPITLSKHKPDISQEITALPLQVCVKFSEYSVESHISYSASFHIDPEFEVTFLMSSDSNLLNWGLSENPQITDISLEKPEADVWYQTNYRKFMGFIRNLGVYGLVEGIEFMYYFHVDGKLQILKYSGSSQFGSKSNRTTLEELSIFTTALPHTRCLDDQDFVFRLTEKFKITNYFENLDERAQANSIKTEILRGTKALTVSFDDLYKVITFSGAHQSRWYSKRNNSYPIGIYLDEYSEVPTKFNQPYACYLLRMEPIRVVNSPTDIRRDGYTLELFDPYKNVKFTVDTSESRVVSTMVKGFFNPFIDESN